MTVVELDSRRPHRVERHRCEQCGHEQVSVHLASLNCQWWECSKCKGMAARIDDQPHQDGPSDALD